MKTPWIPIFNLNNLHILSPIGAFFWSTLFGLFMWSGIVNSWLTWFEELYFKKNQFLKEANERAVLIAIGLL